MTLLLQKSVINHYNKKVKQRFSTKKRILKSVLKVNEKNNSVVFTINKIIPKLLTLSQLLTLNC